LEDKLEVLEQLKGMRGAVVEVHLIDGRVLKGSLSNIDPDFLNVLLEDVDVGDGRKMPLVLVSGAYVATVYFTGLKPLKDLELKVLSILQRNPSLSASDVAKLINERPSRVKSVIRRLERSGLIPSSRIGREGYKK